MRDPAQRDADRVPGLLEIVQRLGHQNVDESI
jgi:hypothetical protein